MPYIAVPKTLREKLGDDASGELVEMLNRSEEQSRRITIDLVEERFHRHLTEELDLRLGRQSAAFDAKLEKRYGELNTKIDKCNADLDAKIDKRYGELDAKIDRRCDGLEAKLGAKIDRNSEGIADLRHQMEATKNSVLRWAFAFWVSQLAAIMAMLAFLA